MRIAIYYPWIYLKSGVEKTILEILKDKGHDYSVFTNHYDKTGTYPEFKKLNVIELKKVPVERDMFSVFKAAIIIASQKIDLNGFDVFMIHSDGLADLVSIRNTKIPTVLFCHTPLRPVFDTEYKRLAMSKRNFWQKQVFLTFNYFFSQIDRYLWKRYKYIFFNSLETLKRAKNGKLLNENSKYSISHPGVDLKKIKPTWKFENYFLVPGRIMWTKNIELVIEAFKIYCDQNRNSDFQLIIAGQVDNKSASYLKSLKGLSKKYKNIIYIKNPSDTKMKHLYSNCYSAVFTSFNEDWGIAPVEANAYGKPVIAVNFGGFRESQINGKTGYLVEFDKQKIAHRIEFLSKNKIVTKKMGKNALVNAKKYNREKFIETLYSKINEIK